MLISHKSRFIFVHVWKTGGNSIRDCLRPYSEDLYPQASNPLFQLVHLRRRKGKGKPLIVDQHITFSELKAIMGAKKFNQYFKFAFVRNPLDLLVSYYHFIIQHENNHPQKEYIRNLKSFEDYIKWSETHEMIHLSQRKFVYDEQGELLADYVGRYEYFQESYNEISRRLGIKTKALPSLNISNHNHFLKYYNSTTEGIVRSTLSEDFKVFNY